MQDASRSKRSTNTTVLALIVANAFPAVGFIAWMFSATGSSVPIPGGGNAASIFAPASGHAKLLFDLSLFVLVVTGIIFVVVFGLIGWAIFKFRRTEADADREPPQIYGSMQIETAWTIIPVLITLVLFLASARVIHVVQDYPKPPGAVDVTVIGHQFWWEFRYPGLGIVTANELHIPVS